MAAFKIKNTSETQLPPTGPHISFAGKIYLKPEEENVGVQLFNTGGIWLKMGTMRMIPCSACFMHVHDCASKYTKINESSLK